MSTRVCEVVKVAAVFGRGEAGEGGEDCEKGWLGLRPVKFVWRGRVISIKEITYSWRSTSGADIIVHFSVTDGATLFELAYSQSEMRWSLEKVE